MSERLIADHFLPQLGNDVLGELLDSAILGDIALTTDSYVVTPWRFPGGDIGRLAVCGTVNDLCMVGARPLGLTAGFILEEGFELDSLDIVAASMAAAAEEAGVRIVAGDTKVVPRGACDKIFINTSGVGLLSADFRPHPGRIELGDHILISGTLADHGVTVMSMREGIPMTGAMQSDAAPLGGLVDALRRVGVGVRALRDPTRGGVAQSLLEMARTSGLRMELSEAALPMHPAVRSACEILGFDPLYVANEGKLLAVVAAADSDRALETLRALPYGEQAARIGQVVAGEAGCQLRTRIGGVRSVRPATGELLPRIC